MNPDEIIRALRENADWCGENEYEIPLCMGDNQREASGLIESLQAEVAASQRRADAAVEDLSTYKDCGFCVHIQDQQYCYKNCQKHVDVDNFRTHPCWQWRGPQEAGEGETE